MAVMNIPGFGGGDSNQGGGGSNDFGGGDETHPGQSQLIGFNDDENGDSNNEEIESIFQMFDDEETDDDDDSGNGNGNNQNNNNNGGGNPGDVHQQEVQALESEIRNSIAKMMVPENIFPENFDPSDSNQLRTVLNKTVQAAVAQSLNVVFKPVQLGMKQLTTQLDSTINDRIANARTGMQDQSILESIVPEINDPKHSSLVQSLDNTLKAKGRKAKDRATTIRKMLNQMGIKSNPGDGGNRRASGLNDGGGNGSTYKSGKAALDSFFGSFSVPNGGGNGNNNGNGNNGGNRR